MGSFVPPLTGHLDAGLTTFIKGYKNNQFFSDILAPRVPSPKQSDRYWIWGKENLQLTEQDLRAAGDAPQKIRRTLSDVPFFADSHALMAEITDEAENNTDPGVGDLVQEAVATVMDKVLLAKENRLATLLTNAANYPGGNSITLSGGSQWDAYMPNSGVADVSDPMIIVEAAKAQIRKMGVKPNWIMAGDPVFTALRNHPSLVDRFKYTNPKGSLSEAQIADAFDIENFYVGSAVVLDDNGNSSFVWGNDLIAGFTKNGGDGQPVPNADGQPSVGRYDLSACKTFVWTGAPGTSEGFGTIVERKYPQSSKATLASCDMYYGMVLTSAEAAFLVANAVTGTLES
jgi:hypothetical protein